MVSHGGSAAERSDRARRLIGAAKRIAPLAAAASAAIRPLAIGGALAAVAISVLLIEPVGSDDAWRWLLGGILLVALLAPAAVLFVFDLALRDLKELPARLREVPDVALAQREELTRLANEIRVGAPLTKTGAIRAVWSLGRAVLPVWWLLASVVPSARILLPPFGLLAIVAAVACLVEIVCVIVAVVVLLVF